MKKLLEQKAVLILVILVTVIGIIVASLFAFSSPVHAQDNLNITEFSIPTNNSQPNGITSGPDDDVWFTEYYGNKIGQITPSGTITEFSVPTENSYPQDIVSGPDGNLWFTEDGGNNIGRVTPSGIFTEFPVPTSNSGVGDIATGTDGNIWFTEKWGNKIGRISANGIITEFLIPTINNKPQSITSGPDGNIWFTEQYANKIGRITPSGIITEFSVPTNDSHPHGITAGSDGNLWFTEMNANKIGRITPEGTITEFLVPSANSDPAGITAGSDGNIWFTEYSNNKIGRVNLSNLIPTPSPTPILTKTPIILIPGIGGSEFKTSEMKVWAENDGHGGTFNYLYPKDETVWLNEEKATDFGADDYFDILRMKTDGITSEADIGTTGNLLSRAYQGTIDFFISNGYELNKDIFVFPYDWRKDISGTKDLLDQKIQQIKSQIGSDEVDIVAHSMGGLVARNYISDPSKALNVRKLFTLGTPNLGSPDSLRNLRYGNCLTPLPISIGPLCLGIIGSEVNDLVRNMTSVFELIPSQ